MSAVHAPGRTPATDRPDPTRPEPVSTGHGALMVAEREIVTQVRTKSFVISLLITLLLTFGGVLLSGLLTDTEEEATPVAVVGGAQTSLGEVEGLGLTAVDSLAAAEELVRSDRKSTRLNSSHVAISYTVFCLKKKNVDQEDTVIGKEARRTCVICMSYDVHS